MIRRLRKLITLGRRGQAEAASPVASLVGFDDEDVRWVREHDAWLVREAFYLTEYARLMRERDSLTARVAELEQAAWETELHTERPFR